MGTWGTGVLQDDTVADVVAFIRDRLKAGDQLQSAADAAVSHFAELKGDPDEEPLLWLAIAHAQWKYGIVNVDVLSRIRLDIESENGLDRWREDPKDFAKRKAVLAKFLAQVERPNPKPSRPPTLVLRRAPFKQGDCLSVLLPDGRHTAALVLAENNTNPECGMNLVASLDYCEIEPPSLAIFQKRKWLVLAHGNWNKERDICWYLPVRFRAERKRITLIGNVPLKWLDPKDSAYHVGWNHLGFQMPLCRAHELKKNAFRSP